MGIYSGRGKSGGIGDQCRGRSRSKSTGKVNVNAPITTTTILQHKSFPGGVPEMLNLNIAAGNRPE